MRLIDLDTQPAAQQSRDTVQQPYQPPRRTERGGGRRLRAAAVVGVLIAAGALLIWLGQPAGAALLLLIGLLLNAVARRDRQARALAQWIAAGRLDEKIEVRRGAWGDLNRAVNGLLQEQRIQRRLRALLPAPLPNEAVRALLGGSLATSGEPRIAVVLLASYAGRALSDRERGQRAALIAWQALAQETHEQAQRHSALLQPCGDAIMLTFGAFEERPAGESLRKALAVAEALERSWLDGGINAGGPLVVSLATGATLAAALPGLGYCVLGAPVEEAIQLLQLARQAQHYGVICGEGVYYALRKASSAGWQPTDLRIPAPHRPTQVVYARIENG